MRTRHETGATVLAAAAALLLLAGAAFALEADEQQQIEQQASALAGQDVLLEKHVGDPEFDRRIAGYTDVKTGDAYLVDEFTRQVVAFHDISSLEALYEGQARQTLSEQELESAARQYLSARLPGRWGDCAAEVDMWRVGDTAEGASVTEARVTFRKYVGDVATCSFVELTLNPEDGTVAAVLVSDGSVEVPTTSPKIPVETATRSLVEAVEMFGSRVELAELIIWRLPETGDAHLTWHVILQTGDGVTEGAMAEGYVDAMSGEVLFYAY